MIVFMNPGSGSVAGARAKNAEKNIKQFIKDIDLHNPKIKLIKRKFDKVGGRKHYVLKRGVRTCNVLMPGLSIDQVQYKKGLNPWNFPRLFVDGGSWLWSFGVEIAREKLLDYNRSIEKKIARSKEKILKAVAETPQCPKCGEFQVAEQVNGGLYSVRCYKCIPYTVIQGSIEFQRMPPKAPLNECCWRVIRGEDVCWLVRGHEGICEPSFIRIRKAVINAQEKPLHQTNQMAIRSR